MTKKRSVFAVIQQIGKSFFLPVAVLPIAGVLLGLGSSFTNEKTIAAYHLSGILGEGTILHGLLTIMSQVGNTIFGNLPLIFALAVALGMAKNEKAVAVLSAGILCYEFYNQCNAETDRKDFSRWKLCERRTGRVHYQCLWNRFASDGRICRCSCRSGDCSLA